MIERLSDVPAGVLGFRASGGVDRDDLAGTVLPAIREAIERGERLRLLVEVGPGFEEVQPAGMLEDARAGMRLGLIRHDAWDRSAIVTDVAWIRRAAGLLGIMVPGQFRLYALDDLAEARRWLAA